MWMIRISPAGPVSKAALVATWLRDLGWIYIVQAGWRKRFQREASPRPFEVAQVKKGEESLVAVGKGRQQKKALLYRDQL